MARTKGLHTIAQDLMAGRINRRQFMARAAALGLSATAISDILSTPLATQAAAGGAAYTPELIAARAAAQIDEVPREETLVAVRSRQQGKFVDDQSWNPFLPAGGVDHQLGPHMMYEPLAFYSAFEDKTIMWLAEGYEYSDDYKTLTITTRPNVTWSDGEPFSAEDVAYTFNLLASSARRSVGGRMSSSSSMRPRPPTPTPSSATSRCRRHGSSTLSPTSSTSVSISRRSIFSRNKIGRASRTGISTRAGR